MALGSSAPEILLNVIDIFAKEFYLEGLGPGTIVGSAAFNLLLIIAVCIVAIPDGQIRAIKDMSVYACTAIWSIFAYLWLIVILVLISPNVVEVWEGVVTFLFFPVLTFMAFACDKGWIVKNKAKFRVHEHMTPEELLVAEEQVRAEHGNDLSEEQVARFLAVLGPMKKTRAHYRMGATANWTGGKRRKKIHEFVEKSKTLRRHLTFMNRSLKVVPIAVVQDPPICSFEFKAEKYAVLENAGTVSVRVMRTGDLTLPAKIWYETSDGTAQAESDYIHKEGWLVYEAGENEKDVEITVVDDDSYELDEEFYVTLSKPQVILPSGEQDTDSKADINKSAKCTIVIIDDDDPGMLTFEKEEMTVYQQAVDFEVPISVKRKNGGCGKVSVCYVFEGDTAVAGRDFVKGSGVLEFENQQMEANLTVTIKGVPRYDTKDRFRLIMSEPEGGVKLDEKRDGGAERNILTISIEAHPEAKMRVDKVHSLLQSKWEKSKVGHANWASQFKEAITVNGGDDDDDDEEMTSVVPPSKVDLFAHIIALPWKVLFAFVPPTDYCGGWACFICALIMIGLVTMIIGDMASLLGCCLCLPDEVTAITFVALGTSLPDTFASKTAAEQDPYADASVGNVTGSNSVNVFLGLGLPWMIASIYWATTSPSKDWHMKYDYLPDIDFLGPLGARSQGFVVEAGSLSFSVAIFSSCAFLCILLLQVRRTHFGGELGGPSGAKWASFAFLLVLWLIYIGLSAWKTISQQGGLSCPNGR